MYTFNLIIMALIKSASIILQRTDDTVLMCKRSNYVSFFPDFWVFPGGKIDTSLPDDWTGKESEVISTIFKELFEEVGMIPGYSESVPPEQRKSQFDFDYDEGVRKDFKDSIAFLGRKRTPPFRKKLYDTAYYHIKHEMIDIFDPVPDGSEIVECRWITPKDAVNQWKSWKLYLPPPTLHILRTMVNHPDQLQVRTLVETELPIGLQTRVEFSDGFELIPFESNTIPPFTFTNLAIIRSKNECMIVDPGVIEHESEHFKQILLSLPTVPIVFLTHHHLDHWNGLKYVEEVFPDSLLLSHPITIKRINTKLKTEPVQSGYIKLGNKSIEVIPSPGHTDSHLSLYDHETRTLIGGDHVVGYGSALLSAETGDMQDYFRTTLKLIKLEPKVILPAHGPPNFKPIKLLKQYIQHRQEREDSILSAINNSKHTLDEIVREVYQDVPQEMWEYAKNNILLHIRKLRNESKIRKDIMKGF